MKSFYEQHHDQIASKRFDSKFPIRRRVHREIYASVTQWVSPGLRVLDAGCGEGGHHAEDRACDEESRHGLDHSASARAPDVRRPALVGHGDAVRRALWFTAVRRGCAGPGALLDRARSRPVRCAVHRTPRRDGARRR